MRGVKPAASNNSPSPTCLLVSRVRQRVGAEEALGEANEVPRCGSGGWQCGVRGHLRALSLAIASMEDQPSYVRVEGRIQSAKLKVRVRQRAVLSLSPSDDGGLDAM